MAFSGATECEVNVAGPVPMIAIMLFQILLFSWILWMIESNWLKGGEPSARDHDKPLASPEDDDVVAEQVLCRTGGGSSSQILAASPLVCDGVRKVYYPKARCGLNACATPGTGMAAVKDCAFHIPRGQIFSLLGPNGAGKTTMLSMIVHEITPTEGEVFVAGKSVLKGGWKVVRGRMGYCPQFAALFEYITVAEHLRL